MILSVAVGLPYFVLSSASPLLQVWYARAKTGVAPISILRAVESGSMLALLSYPVLVEPFVAEHTSGRRMVDRLRGRGPIWRGLSLTFRGPGIERTVSLADQPPSHPRKRKFSGWRWRLADRRCCLR